MMSILLDYFTSWTDDSVGSVHLIFALIAVLAGGWVLVLKKGTRFHDFLGYVYLFSMLTVNFSALIRYEMTGHLNLFHYLAIASLATLVPAYIAALIFRFKKWVPAARAHGVMMIWSYFGLIMALIMQIITRYAPTLLHGEGNWMRFAISMLLIMSAAGYFTHQFIRRELMRTF